MKKLTLVATGVLSMLAAPVMAQSTVTLYGLVDAAVVYQTKQADGSRTGIDAGQLATLRWGMRGSEDLGGGMKAFFGIESTLINDTGAAGLGFGGPAGVAPTLSAVPTKAAIDALRTYRTAQATGTTTSLFDREAMVGLSGDFGSVRLGRQNILGVDSIGYADPIGLSHPGMGNPNVAFSALNSGAFYNTFGTNGGGAALRQNNSIRYLTPVFGGSFGGALMYGAGEKAGNASKNSYQGISGYYRSGNSGAALAYARLKDQGSPVEATAVPLGTISTLTLWGGGVKYEINSAITLKGTYAENKVDTTGRKVAVVGVGVDYALNPALTLTGAYYNTKRTGERSGTGVAVVDGKADQFYAIGKYSLSKRTTLYSTFTHARAGSANVTDTALAAGMIGSATGATVAAGRSANRVALGVVHTF